MREPELLGALGANVVSVDGACRCARRATKPWTRSGTFC